jgi:glutathione synthase/RimK-type ligase-like ATP-grasp enzyme
VNTIVVANPDSRRVHLLQQALQACGLPAAIVLYYADLIKGQVRLDDFDPTQTVMRLESPERNFAVDRAIIAAGADVTTAGSHQRISADAAAALNFDKGQILYPRQWYLGWQWLLQQWTTQLTAPVMNHPEEIAWMFDKPRCHALFSQQGLSVPPALGGIHNYDELRTQMRCQGHDRVFVKLAHGSAASGIVAYRVSGPRESAITTVERVHAAGQTRLYNSRKIRHYTRHEDIADIINRLAAEGVQVEAWLPKAQLAGQSFDLRVVVIGGQAQQWVVRSGKSPMTNLHLGNDRGDPATFLTRVGPMAWAAMQQTCEQAAQLFPRSLYCGIDLLVWPDFQRHAILEINAFGDLLPGITWQGRDTYTSEIEHIKSLGLFHRLENFSGAEFRSQKPGVS